MSPEQRTGWGLAVAGGLLSLLHFVLIKGMTNDSQRPAPRRFFLGWRFIIHGLVFVFTIAALMATLFQKDFGDDNFRNTCLGLLVIWGPAWLIHLVLLRVASEGLFRPERPERPTLANPTFGSPGAMPPGQRPGRTEEVPRSRPASGPSCAHCGDSLSQREVDEGWCDSCGKKLPNRLR